MTTVNKTEFLLWKQSPITQALYKRLHEEVDALQRCKGHSTASDSGLYLKDIGWQMGQLRLLDCLVNDYFFEPVADREESL